MYWFQFKKREIEIESGIFLQGFVSRRYWWSSHHQRERGKREKFKKRETAPGKLRDQSSIAVTNERRRDEMGFPHLKEEGAWCGPCGSRTVLAFD